jgi:DNA-directed RNA polymerase subunit RPC12/RpoP
MTQIADPKPNLADDTALPSGADVCPACGAPLEAHDRFCVACGAGNDKAAAPTVTPEALKKHFRCETCGAEVSADANQRSFTCPFCDSNYVIEYAPQETGRQPPEFVIPFAVTHDQASEKFRVWLSSNSWFRPGDLAMAKVVEKLRGVYLPFWSFSMLAESGWSANIGEYWYRTETYTVTVNGKTETRTRQVRETEWWDLSGRHHKYYSGYLVSGSRGLDQRDADRIKPFHLAGLRRYESGYLAGWLSEEYSRERDEALEICQRVFYEAVQRDVAAFLPGDTHRSLNVRTNFSSINSDLILVPIYLLAYRYRDKVYRFLVNGQTGKLDGDKPISGKRIAIAVAAGIVLIALVVLTFGLLSR